MCGGIVSYLYTKLWLFEKNIKCQIIPGYCRLYIGKYNGRDNVQMSTGKLVAVCGHFHAK